MTRVEIMPGPCGFLTTVTAEKTGVKVRGHVEVEVRVKTDCAAVNKMMEALGDKFDSQKVCLVHPGEGPFNEFAKTNFPVHVACPVIGGITKCVEGESGLGLKKDAYIRFIDEEDFVREAVERIKAMEAILDRAKDLLSDPEKNAEEIKAYGEKIDELEKYYTGKDWKEDFALDEKGMLPADLKRGVLSEDGIYDMLEEYSSFSSK